MKRASRRFRKREFDPVLHEFATKDLGRDIARGGVGVRLRRTPQIPTSILLDPALIDKLKAKGGKRGIGYQTMLKIIVHEHVDEY